MTQRDTSPSAPAYPSHGLEGFGGLTKRELFCLHCMVPVTGNATLDEIIRGGLYHRAKEAFIAGPGQHYTDFGECERAAHEAAENLVLEMKAEAGGE